MKNLILTISPAELWVLAYLSALSKEQQSQVISIPKGAERERVRRIYTDRTFLRALRKLEARKMIVLGNDIERTSHERTVVLGKMASAEIIDSSCGNNRQQKGIIPHAAEHLRNKSTADGKGLNTEQEGEKAHLRSSITADGPQLSASASNNKSLKALVVQGQRELARTIISMSAGEQNDLLQELARVAPIAKSRKRSMGAKLYAGIRFIQSGKGAANPLAWVEGVAKQADYEMREGAAWRAGKSGSDGRSPYRASYGGS